MVRGGRAEANDSKCGNRYLKSANFAEFLASIRRELLYFPAGSAGAQSCEVSAAVAI